MPIFEITPEAIREVPRTSFVKEYLKERTDLQRLLQDCIQHISPDTMVLTEEFGGWVDSSRRIDLLCLDKNATLVVVELKRTEDGGHMDLQAIRYAAMVSPMTFDQAVSVHREYLALKGRTDVDAQTNIMDFLGISEPQKFAESARIVLAAADFSKEITTSVLWLNSNGLDIRCVRLQPYTYGDGKVLLDIQQVIPLPEAAEYQIAIQQKSAEARAETRQGKDHSKFDLTIGSLVHERLSKRDLLFYVVQAAIKSGLKPADIHAAMPWRTNSLLVSTPGTVTAEEFIAALPNANPHRYFCAQDELFYIDGQTFALTNQWGASAEEAAKRIIARIGPQGEIAYKKSGT